ncbi:hypothetical protein SDC9_65952 [bioreactor metagenome]|uniref:N-acetylmuramoyl-L-alanine amidase n=1 Tax=bioreactor metagenome TaxID=1076179 RepID=A0A644XTI4_9ZZZZ
MSDTENYGIGCGDIPVGELSQEIGPVSMKTQLGTLALGINTGYPASPENYTKCSNRTIKYIVIHYVGTNGTAYSVAKYWQTAGRNSSAHFVVGLAKENGQIYQMVDPENKAWHCGTTGTYYHAECRNANSIGIETACHNDTSDVSASSPDWYFDDVTVDKLAQLVKYLMEKYGIGPEQVIRHYDVTHKTCPAMWVHNEAGWTDFKARIAKDDGMKTLVSSVAGKIGLSSSAYWVNVLSGEAVPRAEYVAALFEKVCAAKGAAYSFSAADNILDLNSDDYWKAVLTGTQAASTSAMKALFRKIDTFLGG